MHEAEIYKRVPRLLSQEMFDGALMRRIRQYWRKRGYVVVLEAIEHTSSGRVPVPDGRGGVGFVNRVCTTMGVRSDMRNGLPRRGG